MATKRGTITGVEIKTVREALNLNLTEFAVKCGVSYQTIWRAEHDQNYKVSFLLDQRIRQIQKGE